MAGLILLTGERGYLGSAVAAALDAAGLVWQPLATRLEHIEPGSLQADVVIHCAGALRHRADRLQRDNVEGTARLLAGLRGEGRVLFASSRSVYGAGAGALCRETDAPQPRDDYGRSKHAAEQLLLASGRPVLCSRLTTLFGTAPRGDCPALPNVALRRWLHGEVVQLVGDDFEVDYLAVTDAARALVQLSQRAWGDSVLNLPGPARGLHALMRDMASAAHAQGLDAELRFDHPGGASWPRLDGGRLQQWLPGFDYTPDGEIAAAWLRAAARG